MYVFTVLVDLCRIRFCVEVPVIVMDNLKVFTF